MASHLHMACTCAELSYSLVHCRLRLQVACVGIWVYMGPSNMLQACSGSICEYQTWAHWRPLALRKSSQAGNFTCLLI